MALVRALIAFALFSCVLANSADVELTREQIIEKLWPYREVYGDFVLRRVIGQNRASTQALPALGIVCDACHLAVNLAFSFVHQGTVEEVEDALIGICAALDIEALPIDICEGAVKGFITHVHYILLNSPFGLSGGDVCAFLLQNSNCGAVNEALTNWEVAVDANKPQAVSNPPLPGGIASTKILHLTDIHPDLLYVEGSLGSCDKPICCRRGEHWAEPSDPSVAAGHFGDYSCDIPIHAVQEAFQDAASRYDYKFVLLGGDYIHHAIWLTTKEEIIDHYTAVAEAILAAFPNTPVYPVLGNHETHPTNVFPPTSVWNVPEFDFSWVYNTLADLYASKLSPEASVTFRKAGYYTMVAEPGVRIVALNSMFCYTLNFWILYEPIDPEGQLQWFSNQMHAAEQAGEKVFILGHIPPGVNDCWSPWNKHYSAVIDRYQNIIVGQFYGHTHNDDFRLFFDGERPSSTAWISPSITAYTDIEPGYKVFHFDGERNDATWELIDSEVFTYNLTEANASLKPKWERLYSTKAEYGLQSLRPADLYDFVLRMSKDKQLFQRFYHNWNKGSAKYEPCESRRCIRESLCALLTSNDDDKSRCDVL